MHITPMQMYLITRLDEIKAFTTILGTCCLVLLGILVFVTLVTWSDDNFDDYRMIMKKIAPSMIATCLLLFSIAIALPTTKQMGAILVFPKILNNQNIKKIPNNLLELANQWIEELKPKKSEK